MIDKCEENSRQKLSYYIVLLLISEFVNNSDNFKPHSGIYGEKSDTLKSNYKKYNELGDYQEV